MRSADLGPEPPPRYAIACGRCLETAEGAGPDRVLCYACRCEILVERLARLSRVGRTVVGAYESGQDPEAGEEEGSMLRLAINKLEVELEWK